MKRLLVILAHPDDESFPIGGTLARYADEGVAVTLVCATKGEAGIPGHSAVGTAVQREQELAAAAQILGVSDLRFLDYRDGHVAEVAVHTAVTQLVSLLQEIRPQAVITFGPDGISGHPDHLAVHHLVTAAFDRAGIVCNLIEGGTVSIGLDGGISPCWPLMHNHTSYLHGKPHQSRRHVVGNVNERELLGIWLDEAYVTYRQKMQSFAFAPCTYCGGCELSEENEEDCFGNEFPACGNCLWAQGVIPCP
ncbi:MAG: PIG-L family deacetylase [Anaerolineae bacterium]|nr:PIG-L family deacetylase [Anaerolineae bacterium]